MYLYSIVEKTIRKLKNDPAYNLSQGLNSRQLLVIIWYRALQLMRGLLLYPWINTKGLLFCGRSVIVEHGYMIHSGPSLVLEDHVFINALSAEGIKLGRNVSLGRGVTVVCSGVIANKGVGLVMGDYVGINAHCYIACQGGVRIGSHVIMGPGVKIFSENHNTEDVNVPIRLQGETRKPVIIGEDCWIGAGVIILAGVTIGPGSVVAAGAVVKDSFPAYALIAGVPAKLIRTRIPPCPASF